MKNVKKLVIIVSFLSVLVNCTQKETLIKEKKVNVAAREERCYSCSTDFAYEVYYYSGTTEAQKMALRNRLLGGINESWLVLTQNSDLWCSNNLLIHKSCSSCIKIRDLYTSSDIEGRFNVIDIDSKIIKYMEIVKWKTKK